MQSVKLYMKIIIVYIILFVTLSESTTNNTTSILPNQSESLHASLIDYIPLTLLFIFAIFTLFVERTFFIRSMKTDREEMGWSADDQIRFVGLTVVVFLAIFVIIIPNKSFESSLMAALFGFLGTIVGYLAGSKGE
jgi:hypothetical protein